MFSKKMALIFGVIVLITVNIIFLSVTTKRSATYGLGRLAVSFVGPFQELFTRSIRFTRDLWGHYFFLVNVSYENIQLRKAYGQAVEKNHHLAEIELANQRLRNLLNFQQQTTFEVLAAEVIGKDPSPWFKIIMIDKGKADGLRNGLPVVISQGIVGQIIEASTHYSQVMLVIDRNSAVDALAQRTRARGIIKGESEDQCRLEYVLRKYDVQAGDTVISSGFDGVYPKGLLLGRISKVSGHSSDIFQEVTVSPFVDFEKLEEVLVILNPEVGELASRP